MKEFIEEYKPEALDRTTESEQYSGFVEKNQVTTTDFLRMCNLKNPRDYSKARKNKKK